MRGLPRIVFIDDDGGTVRPLAEELKGSKRAKTLVRLPGELSERDLSWADLLLVDYQLGNWPGRQDCRELALQPVDGLALSAVLRRRISSVDRHPPTAIAMFTGEFAALVKPLDAKIGHHIAARLNGLEWVFEKGDKNCAAMILELAQAVRSLPKEWGNGKDPWSQLERLLGLGAVQSQTVRDDIRECRPPVSLLSNWNHGLIVLQWVLHRVLPYPTCLYSTPYLAARFGVKLEGLERELANENSRLSKALKRARYTGVLNKFAGARWWRGEVERLLWESTKGRSADPVATQGWIQRVAGTRVVPENDTRTRVVCVDDRLCPSSEIQPLEACVRVLPDDWPPFASPAWITKSKACGDLSIGMLVMSDDRSLLGGTT